MSTIPILSPTLVMDDALIDRTEAILREAITEVQGKV